MRDGKVTAMAAVIIGVTLAHTTSLASAADVDVLESAPPVLLPSDIEMSEMLARSDPVWMWNTSVPESVPSLWTEAPFVGNGMVGAYLMVQKNSVVIELGRADYFDVRLPGTKFYADKMYLDTPRLPAGFFTFSTTDTIIGGSARVHLYNASFSVEIRLSSSSVSLTAVALATMPSVLVFEGSFLETLNMTWTPRPPNANRGTPVSPNPPATCDQADRLETDIVVCEQELLAGGGFAMARKMYPNTGSDLTRLVVSLTNSVPAAIPNALDARTLAMKDINTTESVGIVKLKSLHTDYWSDFWRSSMLSFGDGIVESFHAIQMYKVASATRCDSDDNCWAMDLAMPWYVPIGRWHDYHWDLNVQMSYWLVLPSNHGILGNSLVKMMKRNLPYLVRSVPPAFQNDSAAQAANTGFQGSTTCDAFLVTNTSAGCFQKDPLNPSKPVQLGNLLWVGHNLWLQYRYTMDSETLKVATDVLTLSVGYYLRLMSPGADGKLHLPLAESPEYANAQDTNYDLALFRWGVGTLLQIANDGLLPDLKNHPSYSKWVEVASDLVDFPSDQKTGLLIGDSVELTSGHRHWSHLFSIFPTALLNPGPIENITELGVFGGVNHSALGLQSLDHYSLMNHNERFEPTIPNGFPRVAISLMSSQAGRPDAAYQNISNWFIWATQANKGYGGGSFSTNLGPNTMYQEAGGAPCNESPLGAAFAIQSWLLSSWRFGSPETVKRDSIRVFPSISKSQVASIGSMAAEGGYNISAIYENGTQWVHITATNVGSVRQVAFYTDMPPPLVVTPSSVAVELVGDAGHQSVFHFNLAPGQAVLLQPTGSALLTNVTVKPVAWSVLKDGNTPQNYWGKHHRVAFPPSSFA